MNDEIHSAAREHDGRPRDSKSTRTPPKRKLGEHEAKDVRNNLALLYLSILVTVLSLAGFFWLAGILDWRGSEGKYVLRISYDCDELLQKFNLTVDLENKVAVVSLGIYLDKPVDPSCKNVNVFSEPALLRIRRMDDYQTIPTDHKQSRSDVGLESEDIFPLQTVQRADNPLRLQFILEYKRSALLEYIGFSERNILITAIIQTNRRTDELPVPINANGRITFRLPSGFQVAESSLSGYVGTSPQEWVVSIPASSPDGPPLRVKMTNERFARLDHIIDSSIAALLGVGVGGIITAYLALILLRRSQARPSS
jgi:hypothetical protein